MSQPYYPQAYPAPRAVPSSGTSTAALVLGILGFFTCGLASIGAVVCGHLGMGQTKGWRQDRP
jgi:hypothetical protein